MSIDDQASPEATDAVDQHVPAQIEAVPAIRDAVVDQHGTRWLRYGTPQRSCWFSPTHLVRDEKEVSVRLSAAGVDLLTTKSKNAFKKEVEEYHDYREALVADRPGWLEKRHFVYGDGSMERLRGDEREVIVTFKPNSKFTPVGTLAAWQALLEGVVTDQPIPLVVLFYSFVGPCLRFAPSHVQNPQLELVGEGESAKTTLLKVASSVYAGDPSSDVGGGETWDMTINAIDPLRLMHADILFTIDEVNLAGLDSKNQREVVLKAGFKGATNGSRKRLTDTETAPNVRVATLTTSNVPQRDLLKGPAEVVKAFASRIVTIAIPKEHKLGVFRSVPKGFPTARDAAEHLSMAVDQNYGVAGRAFVRRLLEEAARDEAGLRHRIEALMKDFHDAAREEAVGKGKARGEKTFALIRAVGELAQIWDVIPKEWGSPSPAVLSVYHASTAAGDAPFSPPAIERIRAYRSRFRYQIPRASKLDRPLTAEEFARAPGVVRGSGRRLELLIPAERFRREFPDHHMMMKQLRDEGRAQTEGGRQPKNTIKAPAWICSATPRAYCITIIDDLRAARQPRKI